MSTQSVNQKHFMLKTRSQAVARIAVTVVPHNNFGVTWPRPFPVGGLLERVSKSSNFRDIAL